MKLNQKTLEVERLMNDMALVLKLTRRVKAEIVADAERQLEELLEADLPERVLNRLRSDVEARTE